MFGGGRRVVATRLASLPLLLLSAFLVCLPLSFSRLLFSPIIYYYIIINFLSSLSAYPPPPFLPFRPLLDSLSPSSSHFPLSFYHFIT